MGGRWVNEWMVRKYEKRGAGSSCFAKESFITHIFCDKGFQNWVVFKLIEITLLKSERRRKMK